MNEPAVFSHLFRHGGQEGDHVMLGRLFYLFYPGYVKPGPFLNILERFVGISPFLAIASHANISISSHV